MTNTFRALCAELIDALHDHTSLYPGHEHELVRRARAALAEPVPVGASDAELLAQAAESLGYERIPLDHEGGAAEAYACELLAFARAVIARWGRP